jgi:hypothetical protein
MSRAGVPRVRARSLSGGEQQGLDEPTEVLAPPMLERVAGLIDRRVTRAAHADVIHGRVGPPTGPTGVPRTGRVRDHERECES